MARIYKGYPRKLKTNLLIDSIDEYANEINESGADVNKVMQFAPYISLGLNELQSRQSKRVTRISLAISILSFVVAGSALYVARETSHASTRWEQNQLEILSQLDSKFSTLLTSAEKKTKKETVKITKTPSPAEQKKAKTSTKKSEEKPANKSLNQIGAKDAPPG